MNFAVLGRDFSAEHGELTPKNSFRRKQIEDNFRDTIHGLYERQVQELRLGGPDGGDPPLVLP